MREKVLSRLAAAASAALLLSLAPSCQQGSLSTLDKVKDRAETIPSLRRATLPVAAPNGMAGLLPAPGSILPLPETPRYAADLPDIHFQEGNNFDPLLSNLNVTPGTGHLDFAPNYSLGGPIGGLAFATFVFEIPDYELNSEVRLGWATAPASPATAYVGLANWDTNRWDWYQSNDSGRVFPPSLAPYFDFGGSLLAVALRSGSDPSVLEYIRVGTVPPVAQLNNVGPRYAYGQLDAQFDASASLDDDGAIVKYEWDFDGDGSFEAESADDPLATHSYDSPGTFPALVRVTDDSGITASAVSAVSVGGPWESTVGLDGFEYFYDAEVAPDGSIWACGSLQDTAQINFADLLLVNFGADGSLLKSLVYRGNDFTGQVGKCLCFGAAGEVYLAGIGYTQGADQALLQRYSPAGELEWSMSSSDFGIDFYDMIAAEGDIYALGVHTDFSSQRGIIYRFAESPFFFPRVARELPAGTEIRDAVYYQPPFSEAEIRLVGTLGLSGGDPDLLYCSLGSLGLNLLASQSWGAVGGGQYGRTICVVQNNLIAETLFGCLRGTQPNPESIILSLGTDKGYNLAGASDINIYAMWRSGPTSCYVLYLESPFNYDPGLLRMLNIDTSLAPLDLHLFDGAPPSMGLSGVPYADGAFVIGGESTMVGGAFIDSSNTDIGPSADWTDRAPLISNYDKTFTPAPGSLQDRSLVKDTGGGNRDCMVLLHRFE